MTEAVSYVPKMTSNNAPIPFVASASSSYASSLQAYNAFDKSNEPWCSESGVSESYPAWLQIKLDKALLVQRYGIIPYFLEAGKLSYPMSFTFQGSNDGGSWTILDTQIDTGDWGNVEKRFNVQGVLAFKYYRLKITKAGRNNAGQFGYAFVGELNIYEKKESSRHLIQGQDGKLYNLVSGALTLLTNQTLNGANFLANGMADPPNGAWIKTLPNSKILYWQDTLTTTVPKVTGVLKANPPNQIILTQEMTMNHPTILGINSMTADINGFVSIVITFDHNTTWWSFNGTVWTKTTQDAGMTVAQFNAITTAQWANLLTLVGGSLVYRLSLMVDETTVVRKIDVDYMNP